jgi:hypothetical protein
MQRQTQIRSNFSPTTESDRAAHDPTHPLLLLLLLTGRELRAGKDPSVGIVGGKGPPPRTRQGGEGGGRYT